MAGTAAAISAWWAGAGTAAAGTAAAGTAAAGTAAGVGAGTIAAGAAAAGALAAGALARKPGMPDTSAQNAILTKQETQAAEERKRLAAEQLGRQRAAARGGGFRGLLSESRLNAEAGLQNTLGPK